MRNNMRDKLSLIRAINRVVRAEVARSWKGSVSPLEHPAIDDEVKVAHRALRDLVSVILPTKSVVTKVAAQDTADEEPVAWMYTDRFGTHFTDEKDEWYLAEGIESVQPLYASPQDTPRASQHAVTGRVGSNRGQGSGETTC